jgi:hypothetical protein
MKVLEIRNEGGGGVKKPYDTGSFFIHYLSPDL